MPFTVSNSGTIPSVDQFVQTAGDTQGRIKTSNGNVEKASVNATWRPGATNKQTMKDFRRALEMEYGEAVADHTVAQLNLEGKGPNNRTKALTGALVLAAVREANTQRTTVNGPTSLPQVERGGKRMYMDRNPMNDLRSVVDSAKRIRGAKPDAVPRGLPGRGIYASTGSGGSKHQRAVKQLELLEGLEVLGQQIYGDDVEMRDVFISHVRGNMPAAKFKHEDYSTAASNIKSNLDTCEMTMDDFVTVLEGAQAKCDSFAETRRIDSLFEQYNSLLTTAAEHRDIPAEEVQAMRDQINEAKQLPQDMLRISESGIRNAEEAALLRKNGFQGFLPSRLAVRCAGRQDFAQCRS